MEIVLLVEGKTDVQSVRCLVEGIQRHLAPAHKFTWGKILTERCNDLRQHAEQTLRAASATHFVIVTDAWCNPAGLRSRKQARAGRGNHAAKQVGSTCTSFVQGELRPRLTSAGFHAHNVVGVACADLESWFLMSREALAAVGLAPPGLEDPQADCDDETVEIRTAGKERLEDLLSPRGYSAADAEKMAAGLVQSPRSIRALRDVNASFDDFVEQVEKLLKNAPAAARAATGPKGKRPRPR